MHMHARTLMHWQPWADVPVNRHGETRAACGALVRLDTVTGDEPTCPSCATAKTDFETQEQDRVMDTTSPQPAAPPDLFAVDDLDIEDAEPIPPEVLNATVLVVDEGPQPNDFAKIDKALDLVSVWPAGPVAMDLAEPVERSLERRADSEPPSLVGTAEIVNATVLMVVNSPETCLQAELRFDALRSLEADVHAYYDEDCSVAHTLWKRLTEKRGAVLKPIETARKCIGDRIASWKLAQQQREDAERRRLAQEAQEETRRTSERAARAAIAEGKVEQAAAIITEARQAPAPIVAAPPSVIPNTGTTSMRKRWVATINDWPALRAAIGRGECPELETIIREAIQPFLNTQAKPLNSEMGKRYPGCVATQQASLAGR